MTTKLVWEGLGDGKASFSHGRGAGRPLEDSGRIASRAKEQLKKGYFILETKKTAKENARHKGGLIASR